MNHTPFIFQANSSVSLYECKGYCEKGRLLLHILK